MRAEGVRRDGGERLFRQSLGWNEQCPLLGGVARSPGRMSLLLVCVTGAGHQHPRGYYQTEGAQGTTLTPPSGLPRPHCGLGLGTHLQQHGVAPSFERSCLCWTSDSLDALQGVDFM